MIVARWIWWFMLGYVWCWRIALFVVYFGGCWRVFVCYYLLGVVCLRWVVVWLALCVGCWCYMFVVVTFVIGFVIWFRFVVCVVWVCCLWCYSVCVICGVLLVRFGLVCDFELLVLWVVCFGFWFYDCGVFMLCCDFVLFGLCFMGDYGLFVLRVVICGIISLFFVLGFRCSVVVVWLGLCWNCVALGCGIVFVVL